MRRIGVGPADRGQHLGSDDYPTRPPRLAHRARADPGRFRTLARRCRRDGSTTLSFSSRAIVTTPSSRSCQIRIISVHLLSWRPPAICCGYSDHQGTYAPFFSFGLSSHRLWRGSPLAIPNPPDPLVSQTQQVTDPAELLRRRLAVGLTARSAHRPRPAADRSHQGLERRWDLQLLDGPPGGQGCQQAGAVAVDPEHGGG